MLDPVISWFSEMSNNVLPVFSKVFIVAHATGFLFYSLCIVLLSTVFNIRLSKMPSLAGCKLLVKRSSLIYYLKANQLYSR